MPAKWLTSCLRQPAPDSNWQLRFDGLVPRNSSAFTAQSGREGKTVPARRRSGAASGEEVLTAGAVQIDKAAHQVRIDGKLVELSFKEFELLTYFVENEGIALSREKILNSVWNYDYYGDARTIDTHVKKLRAKMGDRGSYIKTIWGMGYKFDTKDE